MLRNRRLGRRSTQAATAPWRLVFAGWARELSFEVLEAEVSVQGVGILAEQLRTASSSEALRRLGF